MGSWFQSITTCYHQFHHVLTVSHHAHHPQDKLPATVTVWQRYTDMLTSNCHCNAVYRNGGSCVPKHSVQVCTALSKVDLNSVTCTIASLTLYSHLSDDVQFCITNTLTVPR